MEDDDPQFPLVRPCPICDEPGCEAPSDADITWEQQR